MSGGSTSPRRRGRQIAFVPAAFVAGVIAVVAIAIAVTSLLSGPDGPAPKEIPELPRSVPVATSAFTLDPQRVGDLIAWTLPPGSRPWGVAVGPDGGVWIAETATGTISELDGRAYTRYELPTRFEDPAAFHVASGEDGDIWFSGYTGAGIGRVREDGTVNYFGAPTPQSRTSVDVAAGPGGTIWVTDPVAARLVRIVATTPASVRSLDISVPEGSSQPAQPYEIRAAADGAMWFTDPSTNAVGRAVPDGSSVTERTYDLPAETTVRGLATSRDSVWVALAPGPGRLLRIDAETGEGSIVRVEGARSGFGEVAVAPDGSLWIPQVGALLNIRPDGSLIRRVELPLDAMTIVGMTVAPDGTVWGTAASDDTVLEIPPVR